MSAVGSAQYSIPIWVPPGPRGVQPALALAYDSGADVGPLGVGWSLSGLGAITRCNKTVAQDGSAAAVQLQASDVFCINGSRLRLTSGIYGAAGSTYQTEVFDGTLITATGAQGNGPASFTVRGRDGTRYDYGLAGTTSQVLASDSAQTVLTWYLSKVTDTAGNTYVVSYATAAGMLEAAVPHQIKWTPTASGSSTYTYTLQFNYSANAPASTIDEYVAGTHVVNNQRLDAIQIIQGDGTGTLIKEYDLTYQASTTTGREELIRVEECDGNAHCLQPTNISYTSPVAGLYSTPTTAISGAAGGIVFPTTLYDINADGVPDLLYEVQTTGSNGTAISTLYVAFGSPSGYQTPISTGITGVYRVGRLMGTQQDAILADISGVWTSYLWNGSSFVTHSTGIGDDVHGGLTPRTATYQLADVNGDGYADLIECAVDYDRVDQLYTTTVLIYLNTTAAGASNPAFNATPTTAASIFAAGVFLTPGSQYGPLRSLDFNGDRRDDVAVMTQLGTTVTAYALIASGNGFSASTIAQGTTSNFSAVSFVNWNDDACTDVVVGTTLHVAGCNGTAPATLTLPGYPVASLDWDGDGHGDILLQNGSTFGVYLSTKSGLSALHTTSVPYSSSCQYRVLHNVGGAGADALGCASGTSLTFFPHQGIPDLVSQIVDGFGNSVSPSYLPSPQAGSCYSSQGAGPAQGYALYTAPINLVCSVTFSDPGGTSSQYTQTHSYTGAVVSTLGRGFAGLSTHRLLDSRNSVSTTWSYATQFPLIGIPGSVTVKNSSSNPLHDVLYSWTITPTNSNQPWQVVDVLTPGLSIEHQYELGTSGATQLVATTSTSSTYDSLGNLLSSTRAITDEDASSPYHLRTWTTATTNTWAEDINHWCINLLATTQVAYTTSDSSTPVTRHKKFDSDTTACRYTSIETEHGTNYQLTEALTPDVFGNVKEDDATAVNLTTRVTKIDWGTGTGQFPVSTTDPAGASTLYGHDLRFGSVSTVTDPNNVQTVHIDYDGLGRKTKQTNADGTTLNWQYLTCTSNSACPALAKVQTIVTYKDTQNVYIRDEQTFTDAVDRVIETVSRNQNTGSGASTYSLQTWQYDALGRQLSTAGPVLQSGGTGPQVTYTYDVLNRVTQVQRALAAGTATTSYGYAGDTTHITDANGHQRTLVRDSNGWLRQTTDPSGYTITLGYDAAGSQTSVTDSQSHQLSTAQYAYGIAPFKVQSTDTDLGAWSYHYNAFGDLTSWTDANGQSFSMVYDALSRPITRQEPDLFTQWTWGTSAAAHEIGQLKSVCTGTASPAMCDNSSYAESETYDALGRPSQRAIQIPANPTTTTYTYTQTYSATTGLPATLTYPALPSGYQLQLQYGYVNGYLSTITDISDNPHVTLWTAGSVDARGQYMQETLGNGVVTTHTFDATTGLPAAIQAGVGGGHALQNNAYMFDPVGNLIQRQDNNASTTESVYLDSADRLDHTVGDTNTHLTYDTTGRLSSWQINGGTATVNDYATAQPGCTYYTNAQLHALRKSTQGSSTTSYCYDANGNTLSIGGSSISWTSYNLPNWMFGTNTHLSYDHNHQRWRQSTQINGSSETTEYIGGLLEQVVTSAGTTYRHYIPAGSNFVVYNRPATGSGQSALYYVTTDHLGSSAVITDHTGALVVQEKFSALGARENTATELTTIGGVTRKGFTGQEQMDGVGLVNLNARIYDPTGSFFLSPDPTIPHPWDARSYNRYAYVRYNPLRYTDPSGLQDACLQSGNTNGNCAPQADFCNGPIGGIQCTVPVGKCAAVSVDPSCWQAFQRVYQYDPDYLWLLLPQSQPAAAQPLQQTGGGGSPQGKFLIGTPCHSPQISDAERAANVRGDRLSFWESRLERGDPMAATALSIVTNSTISGIYANGRLRVAMAERDGFTGSYQGTKDIQAEMQQIGVELMAAHVQAVTQLGDPTPAEIADYHYAVFDAHDLPSATFGGTPLTGMDWEANVTSFIWMSCQ